MGDFPDFSPDALGVTPLPMTSAGTSFTDFLGSAPGAGATGPGLVNPADVARAGQPSAGSAARAFAPLAVLLPLAMKRGGAPAVAALLQGYQQALARKQQLTRQGTLDAQTLAEKQQAEKDRQAGIDNQTVQRRMDLMKQAETAFANADVTSPEALDHIAQFYEPEARRLGLDLAPLRASITPSKLQQRVAQKKLDAVGKTYSDTDLARIEQGGMLFQIGDEKLTLPQLRARAGGGAVDAKGNPVMVPPPAVKPNAVNAGSFEDYVIRYAKDRNKKADDLTSADLEDARKRFNQADDKAPSVAINLSGLTPEEKVQSAAQAIIDGRMAPSQLATFFVGMGQNSQSQLRSAVMERVMQIKPDFNFAGAESNYKFGAAAGTQTTVRYIDNIAKTVPMLRAANQTFKRSNIQIVNGVIQSAQSQIGDVNVADFNFKLTLLADEIAKVLQGGGTGSGTSDAKLRQAQALLDGKMSAAQLETVLDAAQDMLKVRRDTLTQGTFMATPPAAAPKTAPGPNPFRHDNAQ